VSLGDVGGVEVFAVVALGAEYGNFHDMSPDVVCSLIG
jgi:hypothetical protein